MLKTLTSIIALNLIVAISWIAFEPQLSKAVSDSVVITQNVTTALSVTDCSDLNMNPSSIAGIGDGTIASGSCTWTVKTANGAGFNMTLTASTDPALCIGAGCGTASFADYTEANSATPDYSWSVANSAAEFGYTVEPETAADTVAKFLDNGSNACGTGASNGSNTCWLDFATVAYTVVNRSSATDSTGEAEVVRFWDQIGTSAVQQAGTYTATITATVADN